MLKTVVGSFPPWNLPLEQAIECIVDLQLEHGMDMVSDGEQRTDMISYFSSLPGLGMKPTGPYVKSAILPPSDPENHVKLQDLRFVRNYLRRKGREDVRVKVSITGPITLGFACACNGVEHYNGLRDMRLYSDFAEALKPLVDEVAKTGCYLQIDEPSLSIRVMEASQAVKFVNKTLSDLPSSIRDEDRLVVHVCGPLTNSLYLDLMGLEASVLSLAFSAPNVRANLNVISKSSLVSNGKKLGFGCVSVQVRKREEVESLEQVTRRLEIVKQALGDELVALVHPDCGMRPTCREAVEPILDLVASSAKYFETKK